MILLKVIVLIGLCYSEAATSYDGHFSVKTREALKGFRFQNGDGTSLKQKQNLPDSEIIQLELPCGENKKLFVIGLDVTDRIWYTLIAVCFDFGIKLAFCSNHVLDGKGLSTAQGPYKKCTNWKDGGDPIKDVLYPNFNVDDFYKQEKFNETLKNLFGSEIAKQIFIKNGGIERGHLAPNADFFYNETRAATYYFANAVPHWSNLNKRWYNQVERRMQDYARETRKTFNIFTGMVGTLTIEGTPVYLRPNTNEIPVPKFIWKIFQDQNTTDGLAFILYNDLYESDRVTDEEWPCRPLQDCRSLNWAIESSVEKGLIKCCFINDLTIVDDYGTCIPKVSLSGGVLIGDGMKHKSRDVFDDDDCDEACSDCSDECDNCNESSYYKHP